MQAVTQWAHYTHEIVICLASQKCWGVPEGDRWIYVGVYVYNMDTKNGWIRMLDVLEW